MPTRLRLDRIEPVPKTVHRLATWSDPADLMRDAGIARKIVHLVRAIENGTPLPSGYYRKGAGLNRDDLLVKEGIMHLHLGRSNTAELVYCVQYPNDVVLLELSDHAHFAARPVGARLLNRHGAAIQRKEAELAALSGTPKPATGRRRTGLILTRRPRSPGGSDPKGG